jgi:hypothetical protein
LIFATGNADLFCLKAHPGDISGTVGFSAHAAMAVRTPFAGQVCSKPDGATKTTSGSLIIHAHWFYLRIA